MHPKTGTRIQELDRWARKGYRKLGNSIDELLAGRDVPDPELAEIFLAIRTCRESLLRLTERIDAAFESNPDLSLGPGWHDAFTDDEIRQLFGLNRKLREVASFLSSIGEELSPRLEEKLGDPSDPIYDYELEARLDFVLREDDPEYRDDDDNFLTTRTESLKHGLRKELPDRDWADPCIPERLRAEPHCWYFHDLYDHSYGEDSPSLSLRDFLRIGEILVDVQVWQQYSFHIAGPRRELPKNEFIT